jgi:hypothetical protein
LSTLSFSWEGFCLPCHFWIGGLLSYTQWLFSFTGYERSLLPRWVHFR